MNEKRMGVDPSLVAAGARRTLRRLELEAYASVMTAFRAQGPLTGDKKCSLEQLGKLLGISSERHRAEVRRAANDELLSAIAGYVCSADSEVLWRTEGQKLASTNPRFVARTLSHLPQLLTSAAVSSALSLQSVRADPDLKKNTSAQVQNVLKFIISQNPLNAASAAKQQLGKMSLPSGGKPLVKSPSKSPAVSEAATTSGQSVSVLPSAASSLGASPIKMATRENSAPVTPGKKESTHRSSLTKTATTSPILGKVTTPVKSDLAKLGKVSGVGKSSMLVGLLEGRKDLSGTDTSTAMEHNGAKTEATVCEKESETLEPLSTVNEEEKASKETVGKVELMVDKPKVDTEMTENDVPTQGDTASVTEPAAEEVKRETGDGGSVKRETGDGGSVKRETGDGGSTELVCEEVMPETTLLRDGATARGNTSSDAATHPPPPPSSDDSVASEQAVKTEASSLPSVPSQDPVPSPRTEESVENKMSQEMTPQSTTTDTGGGDVEEEVESQGGLRKRTCPTDLALPPPPKRPHLTLSLPPPPPPPPPSPPTANLPLPVPTLSSLPPAPPLATTPAPHTSRPDPQTSEKGCTTTPVSQSPGPPPPLLQVLVPPSNQKGLPETGGREGGGREEMMPVTQSVVAAPLKLFGGVTIRPLPLSLPHTIPPPVCLALHTRHTARLASPLTFTQSMKETSTSSVVSTPPNSSLFLPPPPSLPITVSSLPSSAVLPSTPHDTTPTTTHANTSLKTSEEPLQLLPLTSPAPASLLTSHTHTPPITTTVSSSTADEALIQELCSEAAESTTAAALASQLGLGFLDQYLLGGIDLMQLVTSPLQTKPSAFGEVESPVAPTDPLSSAGAPDTSEAPLLPDTTQLLSEALTSLSTPCTPIIPSSLTPLHPPLFPSSPTTTSPLAPQHDHATSLLTSLSSQFPAHTPTILTPHTPSLSSPLTPEILPDLNTLSSINEEDLLEGIPPELAKTIQALAQLDQQSPLQ